MNQLCETFGIEYPVFAFSHCRDVVAAVSKAGGMGVLGAVAFGPDQLEVELAWIDEEVGGRPYGVDVLIPASYVAEPAAPMIPDEHRQFVEDLLERHGVPPAQDTPMSGAGLTQASREGAAGLVDVALAHPIAVVANALGPAPPELVRQAHERDIKVAALVGKVQHAERQQAMGVDLIVAQGYEAGGHTGTIGTMVLVPEVVDAVTPTPVLAAGGIASGRQMAASMALGASGVWCGSVWLTTQEAETHPVVKEKFLAATSSDTVRSRSLTGKPARQLRSAWTDAWEDPANPDPLPLPLQSMLVDQAQQRIQRTAHTNEGSRQLANYFVGQVVGSMNTVRPASQVLLDMVQEYVDVVEEMRLD